MSELVKITDQTEVDPDRIKRLVRKGTIAPLSSEREASPFLMYLNGDSFAEIAYAQAIPKDIIEATAIHYDWATKRDAFIAAGTSLPQELQKRVANTLLITTMTAVTNELALVASGKKEAKDCLLIPKSIGALRELIDLVNVANGIVPGAAAAVGMQPHVAVQIVNNPGQAPEIKKIKMEDKAKALKDMASKL